MSEEQAKPTSTVNMDLPSRLEVVGIENYKTPGGEERSFSTKLGSMFVNKAHTGFNLDLSYVPNKDHVRLIAMPPSNKDAAARG